MAKSKQKVAKGVWSKKKDNELLFIWFTHDTERYPPHVFQAIKDLLGERGLGPPSPQSFEAQDWLDNYASSQNSRKRKREGRELRNNINYVCGILMVCFGGAAQHLILGADGNLYVMLGGIGALGLVIVTGVIWGKKLQALKRTHGLQEHEVMKK